MSEKQRILDMIEQGKITASEGMDLLAALDDSQATEVVVIHSTSKQYKTLKVRVEVEEDDVNVNINVPLQLVKLLGSAAKDFSKFIPEDAQYQMNAHGVDVASIDFEGIISSIENGTLEDSTIVDINVNDKESGTVKVKVYVE